LLIFLADLPETVSLAATLQGAAQLIASNNPKVKQNFLHKI